MKRIFTKAAVSRNLRFALTGLWLLLSQIKAYAQFYDPKIYPDNSPSGALFGKLFNGEPYLLKNFPTNFHGPQDVYATAYLPYIETEYNQNFPLITLGSNYTTGLALCSPKNEALQLYAPVQIAAETKDLQNNSTIYHPFAAIIPYDANRFDFKGPYNQLPNLNSPANGYNSPFDGATAISALEAVQKFSRFTYELLDGWKGIDKTGSKTIYAFLSDKVSPYNAEYLDGHIFYYKKPGVNYVVCKSITGHELAHGILNELSNPNTRSATRKELDEAFADIMGNAYYNWSSAGKFSAPNWLVNPENPTSTLGFANPKDYSRPNTYQGAFFQLNPNAPEYNPSINSSVILYWFYLINNMVTAKYDNLPNGEEVSMLPLIPFDKEATYKLALRVLFKTFTEKIQPNTTYPQLRELTLASLKDLGYPTGSFQYNMMVWAWHLAGIGPEPFHEEIPGCDQKRTVSSVYNGTIDIPVKEFKQDANDAAGTPLGAKLQHCSPYGTVSALEIIDDSHSVIFADRNQDGYYGVVDNTEKSKVAVSLYDFMAESHQWFHDQLKFDGFQGNGGDININIGDQAEYGISFENDGPNILFNYDPKNASIDKVSEWYIFTVAGLKKENQYKDELLVTKDWQALRQGIFYIFRANIKNTFRSHLANPQLPIWTILEDVPDDPSQLDIRNPKSSNIPKPNLYNGEYWDDVHPGRNGSLLAFWYYLLANGTESFGPQGYVNEKGHTYFVFPLDNQLALDIIWKAYQLVPLYGSFNEFRAATFQALNQAGFDAKSKEYIALFDAWAAVMDDPDHASNLPHEPANGASVYPWPVKLEVQVEYPQLESSRIFEVSESSSFDEQQAIVYRFFSNGAPDLNTGKTFGKVNLLPGKTYFWHSRLYESGGNSAGIGLGGGCLYASDPTLCMALSGKEKWTPVYSFVTQAVDGPDEISPAPGELAPAWDTPFSWNSILNAQGYLLKIGDDNGLVPMQELPVNTPFDEDVAKVYQHLALSKDKPYTFTLTAKAKTGSVYGARVELDPVLNYHHYILLSDAEKAALPDAFGSPSEPVSFKTDIPKLQLMEPEDGLHVPMIGSYVLKAGPVDPRIDDYRAVIYFLNELQQPYEWLDHDTPEHGFALQDLPYLEHLHTYAWTFIPRKEKTLPFILTEEFGETPPPRHFIVDKDKIPAPAVIDQDCVPAGANVSFSWAAVPGAKGYQYVLKDLSSDMVIASAITDQLKSPAIAGASAYPGKYQYTVAAGIQDVNGDWVFGKAGEAGYTTRPMVPVNLSPHNVADLVLGQDQSVTLSWDPVPDVNTYRVSLFKVFNGNSSAVFQDKEVNGLAFLVKHLDFGSQYEWQVQSLAVDADCPSGSSVGLFATQKEPEKPKEQPADTGGKDGTGAPKPGDCPGFFMVSITHPEFLDLSILHHKLGDAGNIEEGSVELGTGIFQPLLTDGGSYYPNGYGANDEVVLYIKVKALYEDWANLSFNQIPSITIVTSGGQVLSHTFSFWDWEEGKSFMIGSYKCTQN